MPDITAFELTAAELRKEVSAASEGSRPESGCGSPSVGRTVAELVPLPSKPTSIPWEQFQECLQGALADPSVTKELAELAPDTTDDLPLP
ncbi:MAG TPA: hypothetical protein VK988_16760 [Acidimicrobiales bacterium]|nr:hypothetical protein [Acidimicrobiales bacterium]